METNFRYSRQKLPRNFQHFFVCEPQLPQYIYVDTSVLYLIDQSIFYSSHCRAINSKFRCWGHKWQKWQKWRIRVLLPQGPEWAHRIRGVSWAPCGWEAAQTQSPCTTWRCLGILETKAKRGDGLNHEKHFSGRKPDWKLKMCPSSKEKLRKPMITPRSLERAVSI